MMPRDARCDFIGSGALGLGTLRNFIFSQFVGKPTIRAANYTHSARTRRSNWENVLRQIGVRCLVHFEARSRTVQLVAARVIESVRRVVGPKNTLFVCALPHRTVNQSEWVGKVALSTIANACKRSAVLDRMI